MEDALLGTGVAPGGGGGDLEGFVSRGVTQAVGPRPFQAHAVIAEGCDGQLEDGRLGLRRRERAVGGDDLDVAGQLRVEVGEEALLVVGGDRRDAAPGQLPEQGRGRGGEPGRAQALTRATEGSAGP
ncbi:hypothetical protein JCM9957A_11910 [Kineosporia succinea]